MKVSEFKVSLGKAGFYESTVQEVLAYKHADKSYKSMFHSNSEREDWRYAEDTKGDVEEMLHAGRPTPYLKGVIDSLKDSTNKEFNEEFKSQRRRRRKDEFDGEICVDTYMSGDPMYYRKVRRVSARDRMINVVINVAAHCGHDSHELMKFYVKTVSKVKKLVENGYMVQVYGACFVKDLNDVERVTILNVKLKEADKPMDVQRVMTLGHIGFFRHMLFNFMHMSSYENCKVSPCGGLGQPISSDQNQHLLNECLENLSRETESNFKYFDFGTQGQEGIEYKQGVREDFTSEE